MYDILLSCITSASEVLSTTEVCTLSHLLNGLDKSHHFEGGVVGLGSQVVIEGFVADQVECAIGQGLRATVLELDGDDLADLVVRRRVVDGLVVLEAVVLC